MSVHRTSLKAWALAVVGGALVGSTLYGIAFTQLEGKLLLGVLLALGALFVRTAYGRIGVTVEVRENGLARIHRDLTDLFTWAEIDHMQLAATRHSVDLIPVGTEYALTLVSSDGGRIRLDNYLTHIKQLCANVDTLLLPHLFRKADDSFAAGSDVVFGTLTLNQSGVRSGDRLLSWADFAGVAMRAGYIYVYHITKGKRRVWKAVPVARTSNVAALSKLLQQLGKAS